MSGINKQKLFTRIPVKPNANKCTTYQNLQNTAKELLRGKFKGLNAYIKK